MRSEARIVWYDAGDPAWVDGSLAGAIQDVEFFGEQDAGQHESGGSAATVNISAFGAGAAAEEVSGGSTAGIGIAAFGDGSAEEQASGGSSAGLLVQAFGDGEAQESAEGGALAAVAFGAFGAGDAEEFASGGSVALFSVSASGGGGLASGDSGTAQGGGGKRHKFTFRVVIDKEELFFDSLSEAEDALRVAAEMAKQDAEREAEKAIVRIKDGVPVYRAPVIPQIKISAPIGADTRALEKFKAQIRQIYADAVSRKQAAMKAQADEEDEILGMLLL